MPDAVTKDRTIRDEMQPFRDIGYIVGVLDGLRFSHRNDYLSEPIGQAIRAAERIHETLEQHLRESLQDA